MEVSLIAFPVRLMDGVIDDNAMTVGQPLGILVGQGLSFVWPNLMRQSRENLP